MASPEELEAERQVNYGDPKACHINVASAWNAYIRQRQALAKSYKLETFTVCATDVANMMALMKIIRAGYNMQHQDNYDDAITYLGFARRFTCGKEGEKQHGSSRPLGEGDVENDPAREDEQGFLRTQKKPGVLRPGVVPRRSSESG